MNFSQVVEVAINEGVVSQILKDGVVLWSAKQARLPKEYQEVEYIHIPNGAYIDTGFTPADDTTFYIKMQVYSGYPFGTGNQPRLSAVAGGGSSVAMQVYNVQNSQNGIFNFTPDFNITERVIEVETYSSADYCQTWVDGQTDGEMPSDAGWYWSMSFTHSMFVGAWWYGSTQTRYGITDIYAVQAKIGSTQYLDLVPCYRKADNAVGMYNLVNGQFLTNAGTGTMTVGPNV